MSALWPMAEATVRDIHRQLSAARPRAYTTVLTIMDRLAQKGIVSRRKSGRAYLYRANLSVEEARVKAVEKIVAGFFSGSSDALIAHLAAQGAIARPVLSSNKAVVDTTGALDRESKPRGLDDILV
jgi:predicted transcriptional regulator